MSRDLRQHLRLSIDASVDLADSQHNFYAGTARNISLGGLFVATPTPQPVGTRLTVRLTLPGGRLTAAGEVVWTAEAAPGSTGHSGMGLKFIGLGPADRRLIEDVLARREPILFEESLAVDAAAALLPIAGEREE
jgi:uncharacterized protein (TIGR02266 family)